MPKTNPPAKKPRRMARDATPVATPPAKAPSKLDQVEALLRRDTGASIAEIMAATGWQQHSVRGAMAGALKKRGLTITSDRIDGQRRYKAGAA
jgi:Protein of unknown function (DUF3489)